MSKIKERLTEYMNEHQEFFSRAKRMAASRKLDWGFLSVYDLAALQAIRLEVGMARALHPSFPTIHHAMAVIREEYKELEIEAFAKHVEGNAELYDKMRKEAMQVAATCIRLLSEL